jgi:hypothetical protein
MTKKIFACIVELLLHHHSNWLAYMQSKIFKVINRMHPYVQSILRFVMNDSCSTLDLQHFCPVLFTECVIYC